MKRIKEEPGSQEGSKGFSLSEKNSPNSCRQYLENTVSNGSHSTLATSTGSLGRIKLIQLRCHNFGGSKTTVST